MNKKNRDITLIIIAIIGALGTVGAVVAERLIPEVKPSDEQPKVCVPHFPDKEKPYDSYPVSKNERIINNRFYNIVYNEYVLPNDRDTLEDFEQIRFKYFQELLEEVCSSRLPISVDLLALQQLQKQVSTDKKVIHDSLDEYFVAVYDSIGYDCGADQFIYKIGLAYEKGRYLTLPDRSRQPLLQALNEIKSYTAFKENPNQPLKFNTIVDALAESETFKQAYCNAIQANKEVLSVFFPDAESLSDCNIFFKSGQYTLNPIGIMVIEEAARHYINYFRLNEDKKFRIVCKGFADNRPVNDRGLNYSMGAHFHPEGGVINLNQLGEGAEIAPRILPDRLANLKLSYARAFSGIVQMQHQIELKNQELASHIAFEYVGHNPTQYANESSDRRIEFELISE